MQAVFTAGLPGAGLHRDGGGATDRGIMEVVGTGTNNGAHTQNGLMPDGSGTGTGKISVKSILCLNNDY